MASAKGGGGGRKLSPQQRAVVRANNAGRRQLGLPTRGQTRTARNARG